MYMYVSMYVCTNTHAHSIFLSNGVALQQRNGTNLNVPNGINMILNRELCGPGDQWTLSDKCCTAPPWDSSVFGHWELWYHIQLSLYE